MLNNLTNFSNLIASRQVKTSAETNDLIVLGTKDGRYTGSYKPSAIKVEDLISQINLVEITYTELQNLVSTNGLVPGQDYLISGVDPGLYGGTDIIIKAATTNQLELQGHGIFYNPKYTLDLGYGIWTDKVTITEFSGGLLSPLDLSFNYNWTGETTSLALNSDGTILIGLLNGIRKVTASGSLSSSISTGGSVKSIAVQPDGKIIVGGAFTNVAGASTRRRIVRLNSNLTLDNTFNVGSTSTGGFNNPVNSVVIQPDGKVLIAGTFTTYKNVACKNIIRVSSTATTDATFTPDFTPSTINCMALQSDGKVLIGLNAAFPGIRRLNADGTTDATFVIPGDGFDGPVYTIALQSDGKIIVGGAFNNYGGNSCGNIARLNTDGSFDNSFNIGTGFDGLVKNIDVQQDDKILVAGEFMLFNTVDVHVIARLNLDGTLDSTFVNLSDLGDSYQINAPNVIKAQPDSKVLVGGNFNLYNLNLYNLIRFKESAITYVGSVVQDSTSGSGSGWEANLNISSSNLLTIDTINYGYGYQTDDTITVLGSQIGGIDGEDDVILNVTNGITYQPGDTIIWGGKAWKNLTGNLGSSVDIFNLNNGDWEAIPYDTINYNQAIDLIQYDLSKNRIVLRADNKQNIHYSLANNNYYYHIRKFGWGNPGVEQNFIDAGSELECLNNIGYIVGNTLKNFSQISRNTIDSGSVIEGNYLVTAYMQDNILENSYIYFNNLVSGGFYLNTLFSGTISNNTINYSNLGHNIIITSSVDVNTIENTAMVFNNYEGDSYFINNIIQLFSIENNNLSLSSRIESNEFIGIEGQQLDFTNNTVSNGSNISSNRLCGYFTNNDLSYTYFENNNFLTVSSILNNTFLTSGFTHNNITQASISNSTLNESAIANCVFGASSSITFLVLNGSDINVCTFKDSRLNFTTMMAMNGQIIRSCDFNYIGDLSLDISAATDIYLACSKTVFKNSAGVVRLSYYDDTDTLVITNIDN